MDLSGLMERIGESTVLGSGGLLIGLLFGFFAQRSRFCLRAAVVEFWRGQSGEKLVVWLLAFSAAVVGVQGLVLMGALDVGSSPQFAARGSISGALIGGLMFGVGMVMTRGCASRLLILSTNGNLRVLLSGLLFAVAAQASLSGALEPLRRALSGIWTVEGGASRDLLALSGMGNAGGLIVGLIWMAVALYFAVRSTHSVWKWVGGLGTGLMAAASWWFTYAVSTTTFEVVPVQGMNLCGPSAEWLMRVLVKSKAAVGFDFGLLPGVFLGSLLGALVCRDWTIEGFKNGYTMGR
jgi:uncharacterized membrane protein YedE/YeeE